MSPIEIALAVSLFFTSAFAIIFFQVACQIGDKLTENHETWRNYIKSVTDHDQYRDGHRDGYKAAVDRMNEWAKGVDDNPDDDDDFDPLDDTEFDHDDDEYDDDESESVEAVAEAIAPKDNK